MTREESIALLDPELMSYLDRPFDDLRALSLPIARELANDTLRALGGPIAQVPRVAMVAGLKSDPDVEVRIHSPIGTNPVSAILHIHGGGMVKGSAFAFDARICVIAQKLNSVVVSVEYRLAPETPFPGPLHDCVAAWNWMVEQAEEWGLDHSKCIITGDSSGGGLAAATSILLRDTNGIMPAGQVLVFPMLDHLTGLDDEETDKRLGWNSGNNQFGWRALLGEQAIPVGMQLGHYAPAHAQSFTCLPPTWIGVGTMDLFLQENITFAENIRKAGGDVTLCIYKGAPHAFQSIPSQVTTQFNADYAAAFASFFR
jgi:acetyl esterase